MRTLKTSLALLSVLVPTTAFAQESVSLEEEAGAAPAADAGASATGSASLDAGATGDAAAATTAAPAPAAAEPAPAAAAARPPAARNSTIGGPESDGSSWALTYSGYFRAPMRFGIGKDATNGDTSIHAPIVPDDQYASWQFTSHNKREWAEMFFTMGNGIASGTVAIQGFQFSDPTWANSNAQFGIGQGWVEVNDDLGFENIKFNAKVGAHWNRYGRAGIYDAGEYDTYLFGRTHVLGGSSRIDIDMDGTNLGFELGYGVNKPNPEMFNRARFTNLAHAHAFLNLGEMEFTAHILHAWSAQDVVPLFPNSLPGSNCGYAGGETQGRAPGTQCVPIQTSNVSGDTTSKNSVFGSGYPNGSQTVVGADARLDLGIGGYLYAGLSHQMLSNALVVGNAIESINSLGAGYYTLGVVDNYLESSYCPNYGTVDNTGNAAAVFAPNGSCSNGTGAVTTILAQYELSLANFNIFDGDQDLRFKLYGMANFVKVGTSTTAGGVVTQETDYLAPLAAAQGLDVNQIKQDGVMKLKFGADAEFFALPWLSAGLRFDRLQPNSRISEQSFMVLSPRISFRTSMVTHETISLQYSRYLYSARTCASGMSPADDPYRAGTAGNFGGGTAAAVYPVIAGTAQCAQPPASPNPPDGFGATGTNQTVGMRGAATTVPDENVIKLEASMWW